jgi:hypothetical protein
MEIMSYIDELNYYGDHRVRVRDKRERNLLRVNKDRTTATIILTDDDSEVIIPIIWEVCDTCEGKGTHVNPSIDANGLSADDFAEDPDFAEDYRSGVYDVICYECRGERVIAVADTERMKPELRERWEKQVQEEIEYQRISRAEKAMGY